MRIAFHTADDGFVVVAESESVPRTGDVVVLHGRYFDVASVTWLFDHLTKERVIHKNVEHLSHVEILIQ